jgi:DNA-binding CsgD family transcriptional regulator
LDTAIASARDGQPTVLAVEGEAGYGKTTLLRDGLRRLDGFHVLRGLGEEGEGERFGLLREWEAVADGSPPPRHTMAATRLLARQVDALQRRGPVALVVDDLQWIDPESVDTVAALVDRTAGDPLLVLAAYRPLGRRHPTWRRLLDREGVTGLRLDGLDAEGAAELVATLAPGAPPHLAEQLRAHTGGSPLFMRALLREHPVRELAALAARAELPAPADLTAAVDARLADLVPDAARMLRTLAVIGDAWTEVPTAVAVGAVGRPDSALAVLRDEGLVRVDRESVVPRVRISHAVVRAAVYEAVPELARRRLHRTAAARVAGPGERLRHRVAAAVGADEGLATDLDRHADGLHERARFREAARFRRLAAGVSAGPEGGDHRLLEADLEAVLAHDLDGVPARDPQSPRERVVEALRLMVVKQWVLAARVLDGLDPADVDAMAPRDAYRARVLRGWATIAAGRAGAEALPPLREAAASAVQDPALQGPFVFAYGQAVQSVTDAAGELWGFHDAMASSRAELAATPEGLVRLSWRGAAYALTGSPAKAVGDLSVVTDRIADGVLDLGDGAFHALLGLAHWLGGQWQRASISIDLASTLPDVPAHPIALATAPLAAVVAGDDPAASLARSRDARMAAPLRSAVHAGDIVDVAVLAFAGTPDQRRSWRARRTADLGDPHTHADGVVPYLWLLTTGIAAAWAGDADATDGWADALAALTRGAWREGAVRWLRAIAGQVRGDDVAGPLRDVARAGLADLPAFEALLWVDAAGAAVRSGHPDAAATRARAEQALVALGAGRYAPGLLPAGAATEDPLTVLSDREREVVALLLEGLSYAQIAEELFVTRSTVAHHLSNTYAKTGTSTRHELTRLVRGQQH